MPACTLEWPANAILCLPLFLLSQHANLVENLDIKLRNHEKFGPGLEVSSNRHVRAA
jgi:hypothetical protein